MNPLDAAGTERLLALIDFAGGVGAERIVLCHDVPREGLQDSDLTGFAAMLSDLAEQSLEQGVRLSLHHHTNQPVMHRRGFAVLLAAVRPGPAR
jgi:sugar phosphate isomerase/epimerase